MNSSKRWTCRAELHRPAFLGQTMYVLSDAVQCSIVKTILLNMSWTRKKAMCSSVAVLREPKMLCTRLQRCKNKNKNNSNIFKQYFIYLFAHHVSFELYIYWTYKLKFLTYFECVQEYFKICWFIFIFSYLVCTLFICLLLIAWKIKSVIFTPLPACTISADIAHFWRDELMLENQHKLSNRDNMSDSGVKYIIMIVIIVNASQYKLL